MSELAELRVEIGALEQGRGRRYPARLRSRIERYARGRCRAGSSLEMVGVELGVSHETLRRWLEGTKDEASAMVVPVEVVDPVVGESTVTLVSPSGWRVEGLRVTEAVTVLRALS